jgi:hypothetical protein
MAGTRLRKIVKSKIAVRPFRVIAEVIKIPEFSAYLNRMLAYAGGQQAFEENG